jgi:hypothetical protein
VDCLHRSFSPMRPSRREPCAPRTVPPKGIIGQQKIQMMDAIQVPWAIVQLLAAVVMWVSLALFAVKTLWNLGVPYAMIHEALVRPRDRHGWSLFILFDIGMLVLALITTALAGQYAAASTWTIVIFGVGAIATSYVHLIAVLLVGGYAFGLLQKNRRDNDPPNYHGSS